MTEHFQFAQPEWLYALPFILCLIILRRRRGAEGSITYPTVRFIASLARTPQSLAGKIGALSFFLAAAPPSPSPWRAPSTWKIKPSGQSTALTL